MSVSGIADLHCHPLANIAFGGKLFWGKPDGKIDAALGSCSSVHNVPTGIGRVFGINPDITLGQSGIDVIRAIIASKIDPSDTTYNGYDAFDSWPRYSSTVHQQMYLDWIKRAHDLGNLNLIVATVVNDELLAVITGDSSSFPISDKDVLEFQVKAINDFVSKSGFMEIAKTPADARRIINSGNIAVVLGIEVDTINGFWYEPTNDDITSFLDRLEILGVNHVITVHLVDNVFGGTAVYLDMFNGENRLLRGHYYEVEQDSNNPVQFWPQNFAAVPGGETGASLLSDVLHLAKGHLYSPDPNTAKEERVYNAPVRAGAGWCVSEMVSD